MKCPSCGKSFIEKNKIGFRDLCDHCNCYLHSCVNCIFYKKGLPNDCEVPETEFIRDRENFNYCEEFKLKVFEKKREKDLDKVSEEIFGEGVNFEEKKDPKKRFDSLFGD